MNNGPPLAFMPDIEPRRFDIYCSANMHIRAEIFDPDQGVCVNFASRGAPRQPGTGIAGGYPTNIISVTCVADDWYQYPDVPMAQAALSAALTAFPRVVLVGGSMGGYAALHWSGALAADTVITFSPQICIGPACPPADDRWTTHYDRIEQALGYRNDNLTQALSRTAEIIIAYDPHDRDALHVAHIETIRPVVRLLVPFSGHGTLVALRGEGVISRLVLHAVAGRFDADVWRSTFRRRRSRGRRLLAILRRLDRQTHILAPATLLRAMALIPIEKWSDAMRLLRLAIKAGLTNEAAALAASLIQNDAFVRSRAFLIEFSRLTPRLIDRGLARVIVASLLSRADESDPAQIRAEQPIIEDLAVALGKTADEAMLAASAISHDRYRRKKVALLVAAAQILAALDDVGEAARTATTAAAMLTVWDETNLVLARLFFDLDRQEDGIAMARRAMACQPDDIKPYGLIAGAMERKGDWQSAATIWAEAFAIGRETPRIAHRLARAWFQLRDFRQALAVIGVGLVADPHQAGLLRLQWQSLQRLGEFAAASASLERLIALTPDDAVAHHALSGMFERLGRDADAAAAARKAVTLEPDNPRFSARLEAIEARR